jgi:L,D-transpeptidase ErfK/SrfK
MRLILLLVLGWSLELTGGPPHGGQLVGTAGTALVAEGDSLIEMARRYDLGFGEIAAANPGLDPFVPSVGARVALPTAWIVPEVEPGTLLVNLSEMRLYLLAEQGGQARLVTFPIGIGIADASTPLGSFRVRAKETDPTWYVPRSVREAEPDLPESVPPGPDNPLGTHALRLDVGTILIHGTNRPWGVGRRVSHGCIRLYPEDIPLLYQLVPVGTPVRVVREPVKVGLAEDRVLVEVHHDDEAQVDLLRDAWRLLKRRGWLDRVEARKLKAAVRAGTGIPVDVGR